MHTWKHSPFALKRAELEEKADEFGWPPFKTHGVWESAAWAPDVDLFVRNHQLIARMDLPGLTKEDVSIEMGEGELTIRGTRPRERDAEHEHTFRCACELGSFFRTVPLPEDVTLEDVKVTFANGILEIAIALPAKAAAAPRRFEIEEVTRYELDETRGRAPVPAGARPRKR
jgi:HSP20 family protein